MQPEIDSFADVLNFVAHMDLPATFEAVDRLGFYVIPMDYPTYTNTEAVVIMGWKQVSLSSVCRLSVGGLSAVCRLSVGCLSAV